MPHSPRMHAGQLWVLNSGTGTLGTVDLGAGRYDVVESVPGYTCGGLAFAGQFAFVGLSKIRETAVFGDVPIAEKRDELKCGVAVIDLVSGRTVAAFQFLTGVTEIFAVDVIPNIACPLVAGSSIDLNEREVWIVPAPGSPPPRLEPSLPLFAQTAGERPPIEPRLRLLVVGLELRDRPAPTPRRPVPRARTNRAARRPPNQWG